MQIIRKTQSVCPKCIKKIKADIHNADMNRLNMKRFRDEINKKRKIVEQIETFRKRT